MTTAFVGQAGVEVLHRVTPGARISQSGVEFLHKVIPGVRIGQAGVEYLHRVLPGFFVSQTGVEVLHKSLSCNTRLTQIWTVARADGLVFRYTALDRDLEWPPGSGVVYDACHSLMPSASEGVSEVDQTGGMDLSGVFGEITEHALFTGLFDNTEVEAWLVPWQGSGPVRRLLKGRFGTTKQGHTSFNVELLGAGAQLQQTALVRTIQPGCWKKFGGPECQKDLAPLTVTGVIDSSSGNREFVDAARGEAAGYFSRGEVTFTSGDNDGITAEIKEHAAGGKFTLWPRLPYGLVAGVTYEMTPGCLQLKDGTNGTNGCKDWDNYVNYGGAPNVPTKDEITASAEVKDPG
jgi:uncharacterized phage protein (TIGR02218 family)